MAAIVLVLATFSVVVMVYFVLWNALQLALSPIAAQYLRHHLRRNPREARGVIGRLASPPLVSIVVPAYNEALTIVSSVRALQALEFEAREIVVVNDGSSDRTLAVLEESFQLARVPFASAQPIVTARVRGIYRSVSDPALVVVDKENGGCKADAANAGINAASGVLVLVIDADTVLTPDSLSRAVLPFLEDPAVVAAGGNIGIINGCRIVDGRITEVALPRSWFARFQIVEYMRAFLVLRLAAASLNAVALISGAFGLFRRNAVIAVGGYDRTAIGEDMDLTIRLAHDFRTRGEPIRIAFDPYPLAWTQAPEDWQSLRSQRQRWRRGLLQVLWRHRRMIGNPRFGFLGLGSLPYVLVFEGLGPLLEISGYGLTLVAAAIGLLNWQLVGVMAALSMLSGLAATLIAVLFSDAATRRYMGGRDLMLLVAIAVLESCGYRQLTAWWGWVGTGQALSGRRGWGAMKRRAFEA